MNIDTDHLHHWMQAIRQSKDPIRTLDAFWAGQMKSKEWLIEQLRSHVFLTPVSIDIHGGWVGTLASMLFQSTLPIKNIRSVDIDPSCEPVATMMNKLEEIQGRFKAVTSDMCTIRSDADIVINTSCEHITQDEYEVWLSGLPQNSIIVLQSNDYDIPEHVRFVDSLGDFKEQSQLNVLYAGSLDTQLYTRWMIIGRKNV
jgi:hypothetical protein